MRAVGIDLGGTKIEAQVFDAQWNVVQIRRLETPQVYAHLVEQIAKLIGWADGLAGDALPVGIGAAGLVHPQTGQALTANLVASG
ncbi:MAG: ROK family protein, partial [Rhodobacteraceae bacterium]|nr:ROK family protein [Paracoccaceae bacterium]